MLRNEDYLGIFGKVLYTFGGEGSDENFYFRKITYELLEEVPPTETVIQGGVFRNTFFMKNK
jgi:hypothetical protein